jgi:hypothetical protein
MVAMMDYKNVNPRDEWGGEKDARGGLLGFIRASRALRGSLPKLDHGFHGVHGFPAAWPRWIWVKPSRTQSHSVALSRTQSNHERRSWRLALTLTLSPRRGNELTPPRQKSPNRVPCPSLEMLLPLLGERAAPQAVHPICCSVLGVRVSVNSQRSGLRLRKGKTSLCKLLISKKVSDSFR